MILTRELLTMQPIQVRNVLVLTWLCLLCIIAYDTVVAPERLKRKIIISIISSILSAAQIIVEFFANLSFTISFIFFIGMVTYTIIQIVRRIRRNRRIRERFQS